MSDELFVKDVMSRPVTISKSALVTEALDKTLDEGLDPLIVLNNSEVMGTVSRKGMAEKLGTRRNSASPYRPCTQYSDARLLRLVATFG